MPSAWDLRRAARPGGRPRAPTRSPPARPAAPSTSTPTRARRSTAAWRARPRAPTARCRTPRARSSPTTASPRSPTTSPPPAGETENVELSFLGSEPKPWLKSVEDPYDDISPRHRWRFRFTPSRLGARLGAPGRFRSIKVLRRGNSPRIVRARVTGSRGSRILTGAQIRARLGLYDSWALLHEGVHLAGQARPRRSHAPRAAAGSPGGDRRRLRPGAAVAQPRGRAPRARALDAAPAGSAPRAAGATAPRSRRGASTACAQARWRARRSGTLTRVRRGILAAAAIAASVADAGGARPARRAASCSPQATR